MYQKKEQTLEMAAKFKIGWTCQQIGDFYGLTQQAVWQRFKRMGIVGNYKAPRHETIDKDRLVNLYAGENLAIIKIAETFGVAKRTITRSLKYYRIPERPSLKFRGKHVDWLRKLNVGESFEIDSPGKNPQVVPYNSAKACDIKISLRSLGGGKFKITRVKKPNDPSLSKLERIDKNSLVNLYAEKRLTISQIGKQLGCNDAIIYEALKLHAIPRRKPLEFGGKFISQFRKLKIGENIEIECEVKYPVTNLHTIAHRAGIKISVRKLGNSRFKITKVGEVPDRR